MVSPKHVRSAVTADGTLYPAAWYPFCLSSELKRKKVIKVRAFGRQWVAFRNESGEAFVMQRYCPHMGVDLSRGKVGASLVCPLHNRKFPESSCDQQRDGLPILLETNERAGIIFVFPGERASLPFPDDISAGCQSFLATYDYPAPFQMVGMNGFDVHHLGVVHKRELTEAATVEIKDEICISIHYKAAISGNNFRDRILRFFNFDSVDICINSYANSILFFDHKKIGAQTLLCLLPVEKNRTRIFLTTILVNKASSLKNHLKCYLIQKSIIKFLKQDFDPLWESRFMPEGLTLPEDEMAILWHQHYDDMPKISVRLEDPQ